MTGIELRAWRDDRGLSRAEAARWLGLSVRGLQDQELGRRKVSSQTRRLAELYDRIDQSDVKAGSIDEGARPALAVKGRS